VALPRPGRQEEREKIKKVWEFKYLTAYSAARFAKLPVFLARFTFNFAKRRRGPRDGASESSGKVKSGISGVSPPSERFVSPSAPSPLAKAAGLLR
jgi:hypothetical protein